MMSVFPQYIKIVMKKRPRTPPKMQLHGRSGVNAIASEGGVKTDRADQHQYPLYAKQQDPKVAS